MSQHRVRPAIVNTSTRRIGTGGAGGTGFGSTFGAGAALVIEAERGEGILGLRNGFAFPNRAERGFQIVGQG